MSGFSDEERDRIREELVATGRELLLDYGPKKTNVADVTEPVGIAKSTFYLFFDSKGDLYLEILQRELETFLANARDAVDGVEDPREGLEGLFRSYRTFAEDNPLVQQFVAQDDHRTAFRSGASPERFEEMQRESLGEIVPLIESLQELGDGPLARHDPVTILGVMSSIGFLVVNRDEYEEFGEDYYDEVVELQLTALARGLTTE